MRICIISPMQLPIPAEKGGAIETIIDQIIVENEKNKKISIDCISIDDYVKNNPSKLYEHTNLIYLKNTLFIEIIQKVINVCKLFLYKLNIIQFRKTDFLYKKIAKMSKRQKYDYIIFEGGSYSCARYFLKYYRKEQLVLHLHHTLRTSKYDNYFGNVICVSEYVKNNYMEVSTIPSQNVYVLKNVVDSNLFNKRLNEEEIKIAKNELQIKEENVLLFCGRLIVEKGIKELLIAFRNLEFEGFKLIVIGSSNFGKKALTKFEKELHYLIEDNPNVIFLGYVSNKELYKYYQISDLFVMPSNIEEAAGLVNLESKLSGTPIITTKMGGIPEYVSEEEAIFVNNDSGFVNNLKDTIINLFNDKERLIAMSNNCLKENDKLTTEYYYNEFINIINSLNRNGEKNE